jgi:folate-binding protein YgfZ
MADDYRHALEDCALFDLIGRGLIALSGRDAVTFLNNLCTNDVKGLPPGHSCEAFLTTAKARVVAHLFVLRLRPDDGPVLWLDLPSGQVEKVLQHLGRYLISEDVELFDQTREVSQMHLCGPGARRVLERVLSTPLPELKHLEDNPVNIEGIARGLIRRHDYLGLPGYDVFSPRDRAERMCRLLTDCGAVMAGPETYEVLRVEAGFPLYGPDMDEDRFVVEVGRNLQAISYTKGCYLGQEPIVMARDRGHANRTLLGLKIQEGGPAAAGSRVLRGSEEVGQVTSSVWSPRLGSAIALAYLRRGGQEPGTPVQIEAAGVLRPGVIAGLPLAHLTIWSNQDKNA